MGNRRAIWSSKAGRQRAPFLSRACRKRPIVAKNGLAKTSTLSKGQGVAGAACSHHEEENLSGEETPPELLFCSSEFCEHVLVDVLLLEAHVTTGDVTPFNPFWEAGNWWEATLSPWLLSNLAHDEDYSLTRSWLNFPSSFILMP